MPTPFRRFPRDEVLVGVALATKEDSGIGNPLARCLSRVARGRGPDALAALGLTVLLGWFFFTRIAVANQGLSVVAVDLFLQYLPWYTEAGRALHEGRVPLWNPYQACGQPFLATLMVGFFYPARLLLLAFDPAVAMGISAFLHLALAALGVFALVRALGAGRAGAIIASAGFTYGFGVSAIYLPATFLEPGAWFPIAAYAIHRIVTTRRWRYVALAAAAVAFSVLAGGYQVTVYIVYALALLAIGLALDASHRSQMLSWGTIGRLLAAGLLAVALSSVQWAPTLLWTSESMRSTQPLPLDQIFPLGVPDWKYSLTVLTASRSELTRMFVPAPLALLALLGAVRRPLLLLPLFLGGVLAFLLSLGPVTPWFPLYYALPGLSMFRQPARLGFLVIIAASLCAAFGVDALVRLARPPRRVRTLLASAAILGTTLASLGGLPSGDRFNLLASVATLASALLPAPLVGAAAVGPVVASLIGTRRNASQLPYAGGQHLLGTYHRSYEQVSSKAGLSRVLFVGRNFNAPEMASKQGTIVPMYVADDYEPLASRRLENFFSLLREGRPLRHRVLPGGWKPGGFLRMNRPPASPRLVDMMSVRYLIVFRPALKNPEVKRLVSPFRLRKKLVVPSDRWGLRVYANPSALPRAYTVVGVRAVANDDQAAEAILDPTFDPHREAVIVGGDESRSPDGRLRKAEIITYDRERVVVRTSAERRATLVLTDAYAPGWVAALDGRPTPVRRANYLFRSVEVPPGEHEVVFRYEAPGYRAGAAASALAIAVLALVPLGSRLRAAWKPSRRP